MAKRTATVDTAVATTDTVASDVATAVDADVAVVTQSVMPTIPIDTLIATLTNLESRAVATQQLDARIAARKAELDQLLMARRALDPQPVVTVQEVVPAVTVKTPSKKIAKKVSVATTGDHASAILSTLKGEKNGLTIADISKKLNAMNHTMDQKSLASYLWSMTKSGKLSKEGERGQFRYKPVTA